MKIYMDILRRSSIVILLTILVFSLVILIFSYVIGSNIRPPAPIIDYSVTNWSTSSTRMTLSTKSTESMSNNSTDELPDLSYWKTNKTDQFLVDMANVTSGTPFLGKDAEKPHSGAHLLITNKGNKWPVGGSSVTNYPPIYAVADGVIDRVTPTLKVGLNDRYGINLGIAKEGSTVWSLEYSIEPMVPEPSKDFYLPFVLVKEGQKVKKGDIIAYFYVPQKEVGTHIHFELIGNGVPTMKVPNIFTPELLATFYPKYIGLKDGGKVVPNCVGYKVQEIENPFESVKVDCLN